MKKEFLVLLVIITISTVAFAVKPPKENINKGGKSIMTKNILMILAENPFRDPEYFEPKKVLEAGGYKIITTCTAPNAHGAEGATVKADILFKDVVASDYVAIIFIGGTGSYQYHNDKKAHELASYAAKNKILGSICASVGTLANAGVLKGKKATSFSGVADMVKAGGAIYTGEGVTVDGNIVTADGPQSAKAFGEAVLKVLNKK
jgi:protease I